MLTKSGVAHFIAKDELDCMDKIKTLLSYLPQNNTEEPILLRADMDDSNRIDQNLINILPENPYHPYDIKEIIKSIVDHGNFLKFMNYLLKNYCWFC